MHPHTRTVAASTALGLATLFAASACSLIYDFVICDSSEQCGEGFVCTEGACVADDGTSEGNEVEVSENITEDTVWEKDQVYRLTDTIYIENGATLTIRAGTTVIGDMGSALVATAGSRLEARGTEFEPVVFTSSQPEGSRLSGDWGGVAMLGRALVNEPNPVLEGLEDASRAAFGGTEADWSCGVLEYTRIEFAGFPLETDKELNGLTLGGCGSGTLIDYVQVHFGKDDGIEVFGGNVDLKHAVITRAQDDSLDWDRGWTGRAQFIAIQQDNEGDNGMECDNWSDGVDAEPRSKPVVYNATMIGSNDPNVSQRGATYKEGTAGIVRNALFMGHPTESVDIKGEVTAMLVQDGEMVVENSWFFGAGDSGSHYFPLPEEELGEDDDDGAFDESAWFLAVESNTFDTNPDITNAYDLTNPGWVPGSVVAGTGDTPPGDGFFDEASDYPGAFAPGVAPWTQNWTAYPEN